MDIGIPELFIILVIVILIFGPGRIAKLSREVGTGIRQFREGLEDKSNSDEREQTQ